MAGIISSGHLTFYKLSFGLFDFIGKNLENGKISSGVFIGDCGGGGAGVRSFIITHICCFL